MEKEIIEEIIKNLRGRRGFHHWWDDIDTDIKDEIKETLENIIKSKTNKYE